MARDATARLYDVDDQRVELTRLYVSEKYDHAEIRFQAKEGKQIDLANLHESLWASRLSRGTRSGALKLVVTAVGTVKRQGEHWVLSMQGTERSFVLQPDPEPGDAADGTAGAEPSVQRQLERAAKAAGPVTVVGRVEGWTGRWPSILGKPLVEPLRLLVMRVEGASS